MVTLKTEARDKNTNTATLRKEGKIPAVFYGKKEASTPISIALKDFLKVFSQAGESAVVSLETADGEKESLIHEVDFHPVTGEPRHADFYVFEKGHKVRVEIPIEFDGVSPAVKELGGTLVKVIYALAIEAMPKDLPHELMIDISVLKSFEDQILAKDIKLPSGVVLTVDPEEVVALVSAPREEKEEEVAPVDLSAIEVEKKGKDEAAEDAPAAEAAA